MLLLLCPWSLQPFAHQGHVYKWLDREFLHYRLTSTSIKFKSWGSGARNGHTENSNTIPLEQLKFGCKYMCKEIRYRKFPKGPLASLSQFMNAPYQDT